MFIEREMAETLRVVMNEYPIVTISGPRQSGKTTLAKKCLPEYGYVNLEDADSAEFARSDPKGFLRQYSPPLIIDEAQRVPELMSSLGFLALPEGKKQTIAVRPVSSLGTKGKTIGTTWRV